MSVRIAICGLHTECATENPLLQRQADFTRISGDDLLQIVPFDFTEAGLEAVPIFQDRSVPGGPVAPETFAAQRKDLLDALEAAMPLDGVLLLMHGAMFVPGIDDPEGALVSDIRALLGPDAILAGSFDLHGQVTEALTETLDIFVAYRTAPHIDVAETHARAAAMLARALKGVPRPQILRCAVPVLVSGEMSSTFVAPCDLLYAELPKYDARPGVWDANLMIGYVWADSPRATAAAVVTATDPSAGQLAAREIAQSYWDARHDLVFDSPALPLAEALKAICDGGILADSGDNPTGGGVGDRADVFFALLDQKVKGAAVVGIADPPAYEALKAGRREITIGGSLGGGGPRRTVRASDVCFATDCALLRVDEVILVVTKRRRPFHNLADFDALGLNLEALPVVVVKSGYLSPDLRTLSKPTVMALTDGSVNQDLKRLPNLHRTRPTWPFQRGFGFSARAPNQD